MFDTIHVDRRPSGPQSISIFAPRDPTDKSVELLKEMEQAALDKLLEVHELRDNEFNATWYVFREANLFDETGVCMFKLNGVDHKVEVSIDTLQLKLRGHTYFVEELRKAIFEVMFKECITALVKTPEVVHRLYPREAR